MERYILHVDMDAFFASVEQRDDKSLRGKPVIVGGTSKRGVVATCSYEARKYGIHSAMPIFTAQKLCPHGIYIRGNFDKYVKASHEVFEIIRRFTTQLEQVSIDEAYIDLTEYKEKSMSIAMSIKNEIKKSLDLTISMGLSYNKFLAKLASDWNKPDGFKIITKDMVPEILFPLPVEKVHGLGKKSAKRLNNIGIYTVEDLHSVSLDYMVELFGRYGIDLYNRIRGIDNRPVVSETSQSKSIGCETTMREDTIDKEKLIPYLNVFSEDIALRLGDLYTQTLTIKYKTSSFVNHTRSKTLKTPIKTSESIKEEAIKLLYEIDFEEKIRLIGLSASNFTDKCNIQLSFI